jgi:hypothetical protein
MMKTVTLLLTAGLALAAATQASAQTELNSRPEPGRTGPATAPAPAPAPYTPAYRPASASDPAPRYRSSLSLEVGWGAPYGFGVTYAYQALPALDVNGGLGIGVGTKFGVGARYYILPQRALTPYLGVNLVRTGGKNNIDLEVDGERVIYSMAPSGLLHLRGGLRWQPGRLGVLATAGYAARLSGDPITYDVRYNPSQELRDLIQSISPGGAEFSFGLVIGLGR